MRKIDSKAYNKRLHAELMELDKLLNRINPEHVNYLDSSLIKTAKEYQQLLKECEWSSNSNFNGIEVSKVKQLLTYMKNRKKRLYVNREVIDVSNNFNNDDTEDAFASGAAAIGDTQITDIPDGYDGRNSFVRCQIVAIREDEGTDGQSYYKPVYISDADLVLDQNGLPAGRSTPSGYSTTGSLRGNCSFLMAIKNSTSIDISYKVSKLGFWSDAESLRDSNFVRMYLDVFYVLWR